jgi:outer membrane immunogenic protein
MLRRIFLSSAGALALTGAAFAADLPSHAPPPVFVPPPPLFSWTGLYAGINAGYHWGGSSFNFTGTDTDGAGIGTALNAGAILFPVARGASGFIGGGQIGYNYQIQSFVLGLEVDIDGATGRNSRVAFHDGDLGFVPIASANAQQLDWLGTVRGRLGWTPIDHLLIYGTGGLAFGQSQAAFSVVAPTAGPPVFAFASNSAKVGWAAGGGVEYALPANWSNWSVKVEYLYYDLGRTTSSIFYTYAPNTSSVTGSIRHNGNIIRAGLNYRFNWWAPAPIVAKY